MFLNFGVALVVIELGVTNLILSVIVESSQAVSQESAEDCDDRSREKLHKVSQVAPEDDGLEQVQSFISEIDSMSRNEMVNRLCKGGTFEISDLDGECMNVLLPVMG